MVQGSKRSLHPGKAAEMEAKVHEFHWEVRKWCGEIPIGTTVYVALEGLNHALSLTDLQLNRAIDEGRRVRSPAMSALTQFR